MKKLLIRDKEPVLIDISQAIESRCQQRQHPDKTVYRALLYKDECDIALTHQVSHKAVQLATLRREILPERYARNQKSLSCSEQIQLLNSHVAVIGAGGLGGFVIEALARTGVGELTIVDGDCFEENNLNRQLFSTVNDLGQMKVDVAQKRVASVNPAVEVTAVAAYLSFENGKDILQKSVLAVDCLDGIGIRFFLENLCKHTLIPLVSAAIGGSCGQAMVIFPEDAGFARIYPTESVKQDKLDCHSQGTLPYVAMSMAAHQCAEVVSCLLGKPSLLRNKLLLADVHQHSSDIVRLSKECNE